MLLPPTVRIGATTWKVEIVDSIIDDDSGHCNPKAQTIQISKTLCKEQREMTFIHELLHACCSVAGMREGKFTEEEFVSRIESSLYGALTQNKLTDH